MLINKNIAVQEVQVFDLPRKVIAHMTSSSWRSVPHVTYLYEPDITEFKATFESLVADRRARQSRKLSFNTILLKAIVEGLLAAPKLNSLVEYNPRTAKGLLRVCADINISLPWLLPDGRMITPIIRKADKMTLDAINDAVAALARRIEGTNVDELLREAAYAEAAGELRKLQLGMIPRILSSALAGRKSSGLHGEERKRYHRLPDDLRLTKDDIMDGTITVSNIGALYLGQRGALGLLEVISPQVLAIGIGAVQEKPGIFIDGTQTQRVGIRKFLPMCLAFDHRAVDFSGLVPFLKRMDEIFVHPQELCSW